MSEAIAQQFAFSRSLETTWEMVWRLLSRGVADRHAPERHPTLATIGLDGSPQIRTVVLRAAARSAALLDIHTDLKSAKVAELQAGARCALHVWNSKSKLQMRLDADADILSGGEVAEIWQRVPDTSRNAYGGSPHPGLVIEDPEGFQSGADPNRFAVLRLNLRAVETLCLAPDRHYRARFLKSDNWSGQWLAP